MNDGEVLRRPNPGCPFAARHGYAAEYRPGSLSCSDCGAALVLAETATAATRTAEIGREVDVPLLVPSSPADALFVNALAFLAVVFFSFGMSRGLNDFDLAHAPFALLGLGCGFVSWHQRRQWKDGVVRRHERGFSYERAGTRWSVAYGELAAVSVTEYPLAAPQPMTRNRYQVLLRLKDGQSLAIQATVTRTAMLEEPFVVWARSLAAKY
jgi:hypothetical protein